MISAAVFLRSLQLQICCNSSTKSNIWVLDGRGGGCRQNEQVQSLCEGGFG